MSVNITWNNTAVALFSTGVGQSRRNLCRHSYTYKTRWQGQKVSLCSLTHNPDQVGFQKDSKREGTVLVDLYEP